MSSKAHISQLSGHRSTGRSRGRLPVKIPPLILGPTQQLRSSHARCSTERSSPEHGDAQRNLQRSPGFDRIIVSGKGFRFAMLPHEHNEILTKEEFCHRLLEAVQALEPLSRSWYAASRPLMQRSDKGILEVIFNAQNSLNALEIAIENGSHNDYFAHAAKIEANNVSRFHAVSGTHATQRDLAEVISE